MPNHHQLTMGPMPLSVLERGHSPAKVTAPVLKNVEKAQLWAELGKCMVFVCYDLHLSLKEFAARIGKADAQISRQMEGKERPQIEAVFAVPEFRAPLVLALARLTNEIETFTEMRMRSSA